MPSMPPIGEVGGLLGMAVSALSLMRPLASWIHKLNDHSRAEWFRDWTKAGADGDEHFAVMFDRHFKDSRRK